MNLGPARVLWATGKSYALPVLLSPEDYDWAVAQGNWFITHGTQIGAKNYAVRSVAGRLVFLHKVILERAFRLPPTPAHTIGDHWNGQSLDCRRKNLKWATPGDNARNIFGFAYKQMELAL